MENNNGVFKTICLEPNKVHNQEKTFIPVGTAIIIVADVK
tara:strand:- start:400 stop:519 length:120 start_codon:yes stop_codon:yes gene_type:complete